MPTILSIFKLIFSNINRRFPSVSFSINILENIICYFLWMLWNVERTKMPKMWLQIIFLDTNEAFGSRTISKISFEKFLNVKSLMIDNICLFFHAIYFLTNITKLGFNYWHFLNIELIFLQTFALIFFVKVSVLLMYMDFPCQFPRSSSRIRCMVR